MATIEAADPPQGGLIKKTNAILQGLGSQRWSVKRNEPWHRIASYCGAKVCRGKDSVAVAAKAIQAFIGDLAQIPEVEGIMFLASRRSGPTVLTLQVLAPFEITKDAGGVTASVTAAKRRLAKAARPVVQTGLRFFDTSDLDIDQAEQALRESLSREHDFRIIGLMVFESD
jgi:hypothetical protein